jgi:crotonobetainyl-CoA:carnitine CoA-transferase CaiB-like acyl-CoA transferase
VYRTYETKDARFMALAALEPKFWRAFCEGVGWEFAPEALLPGPHQEALHERLASLFRSRTQAEWTAFSETLEACLEPILTPEEALRDRHARERGMIGARSWGLPFRIDGEVVAGTGQEPPPRHGEHTDEVLPPHAPQRTR